MSTHVYLTPGVRNAEAFKTEKKDVKFVLNDVTILQDRARLYVTLCNEDKLPTELEEFVEEIILFHDINMIRTNREIGIYRHESAEAEVEITSSGRKEACYRVRIVGKKMDDVHSLLRQIKTGTIRPEESYEASQCGKSRKQLEAEVEELRSAGRSHGSTVAKVRQERDLAQSRVKAAYRLSAALEKSIWPWSWRSTVATRINLVLNNAPNK